MEQERGGETNKLFNRLSFSSYKTHFKINLIKNVYNKNIHFQGYVWILTV